MGSELVDKSRYLDVGAFQMYKFPTLFRRTFIRLIRVNLWEIFKVKRESRLKRSSRDKW